MIEQTGRIMRPSQEGSGGERTTGGLNGMNKEELENIITESLAKLLIAQSKKLTETITKQIQTVVGNEGSSEEDEEETEESNGKLNATVETVIETPVSTKNKVMISSPQMIRRHTVANIGKPKGNTGSGSTAQRREFPNISSQMAFDSQRQNPDKGQLQASSMLGTVPDLPLYFESKIQESGDEAEESELLKMHEINRPRSNRSNRSLSTVTDYNDDTFDSESASGSVHSPDPYQRQSFSSLGRRSTTDLTAISSISRDQQQQATTVSNVATTSPLSKTAPAPPPNLKTAMRRASAAPDVRPYQPPPQQPPRTPTFIIGEDGHLQRVNSVGIN